MRHNAAEFIGTFWLVLGGCGSMVLAAGVPEIGIGLLGIALAFGFSVLTMGFAIGDVSGCHLNPAVSIGLWASGRFPGRKVLPYILSQVAGGIIAGGVLYAIARGAPGFEAAHGFAANGYGEHSPGGYSLFAGFLCEVVMTMFFVLVVLGTTAKTSSKAFAPVAIGLALALIHLISLPVTNTSVNPARSTAVAFYAGGWAVAQLWMFWLAPLAGALLGALLHRYLTTSTAPATAGTTGPAAAGRRASASA